MPGMLWCFKDIWVFCAGSFIWVFEKAYPSKTIVLCLSCLVPVPHISLLPAANYTFHTLTLPTPFFAPFSLPSSPPSLSLSLSLSPAYLCHQSWYLHQFLASPNQALNKAGGQTIGLLLIHLPFQAYINKCRMTGIKWNISFYSNLFI